MGRRWYGVEEYTHWRVDRLITQGPLALPIETAWRLESQMEAPRTLVVNIVYRSGTYW
jgi:hypothetical protein